MIINNWESQMSIHALQVPCNLLMLQLMRFAQTLVSEVTGREHQCGCSQRDVPAKFCEGCKALPTKIGRA